MAMKYRWICQFCLFFSESPPLNFFDKTVLFYKKHALYENIDQILPDKLHGAMHYKQGVTCVYDGLVFCTLLY